MAADPCWTLGAKYAPLLERGGAALLARQMEAAKQRVGQREFLSVFDDMEVQTPDSESTS